MTANKDELTMAPSDGCYIYGLYFEGARWDAKRQLLGDSKPKVIMFL